MSPFALMKCEPVPKDVPSGTSRSSLSPTPQVERATGCLDPNEGLWTQALRHFGGDGILRRARCC